MKKRLALILVIASAILYADFRQPVESQKLSSDSAPPQIYSEIKPQTAQAAAFAVSEKVSNFAPASPEAGQTNKRSAEEKARAVPNKQPFRKQIEGAAHDTDSALAVFSAAEMPPSLSFDGVSSNDNAAAYAFRLAPPDPNGDVGLNNYVQSVNALTRVYDKNGTPLTPPFKLSSIFSPLGTPCSRRDDGDPIVHYDVLTDRWLLSQYCTYAPPFRQLIAISQTGDPTGSYYLYEFILPNNKLNDYPKLGVWTDGYYMTADEFIGSDYTGTGVFAFEKKKMLVGDRTASFIYFDLASPSTIRLGGLLPSDFDGLNPPPPNAPNIFVGYTATEYGDARDALRLFNFHADFVDPSKSTFTERAESPIDVAPFDPTSPNGREDVEQPPPGDKLDSQSDRLMYRAAYRNFGTHESLVVNQTVRLTPVEQDYRAGVRVYELQKSGSAFTVRDQATLGDTVSNRWMASAAQDFQGNLAVSYSFSNGKKFPSIFYSGKLASDPAGTFRAEETLISGTGIQTGFGSRWGDYTSLSIDPTDDCTFWMTNEYYTAESQAESPYGWLTRIGKFKFPECVNAPRAAFSGIVTNAVSGQPIAGATVTANESFIRSTGANGSYGSLLLMPNTYILTVSAPGFRSQTITVTIENGQTLTQNFALQPTAVLTANDYQFTSESCAVNGAIDPGETVTLNIALANTGAANTDNLTATLLATGGVINPGPAQNFGALNVGGKSVSRPFTFTASPNLQCGAVITLTLRLNDGAEQLGTVTVPLNVGTARFALQENFDAAAAPSLPNGWTTSADGAQQIWKTSAAAFDSPPNAAFSPGINDVGINELMSPAFQIVSENAELTFRNRYDFESSFLRNQLFDGGVLEIKIGARGRFEDILAAGGTFETGGYDGIISNCCQNPLAGRPAWTSKSGTNQTAEFVTTKVKLPTSAAGRNVQLRWRVGTDMGTASPGQYIDNVVVADGYICACQTTKTGRAPFDFDGDGKTDFSVFRPSDAPNAPDFIISTAASSTVETAWGSVGDAAVNADYDGDGVADYAVFRPSSGYWFILRSSDNTIMPVKFGLATDRLTPADFDGDGVTDIAVFRPSNGFWYVLQSSDGKIKSTQFGAPEDLPVPADFDGDGKTDYVVFRPSSGFWYVQRSSDGGFNAEQFGTRGDQPVVGDYDGDGHADYAVFRPSSGVWYLLKSNAGFNAVQFGASGDQPLQADFDGDGKRDLAVYRPSTGYWYYLKSSDGGFASLRFGNPGDTAVPSIYVP